MSFMSRFCIRAACVAAAAGMLWSLPVQAATYYVAPNGADSAAGTQDDPWSLDRANEAAQAGDTIVLLDGNYETSIAPAHSGSEGSPITYVAANLHQATFDNGFSSSAAILLTDRSYIVVDGIA